jgi:predicted  nucleic acid-binding Zn-ribbon protein
MPSVTKIDRRLKRLAGLEASYRRALKQAQEDVREGRMSRARLRRIERRCQGKMDRLGARIRALRERRSRAAEGRGVGKGI